MNMGSGGDAVIVVVLWLTVLNGLTLIGNIGILHIVIKIYSEIVKLSHIDAIGKP